LPYGRYKNRPPPPEPPTEPIHRLRTRLAEAAEVALQASDLEGHRSLTAVVARLDELVVHLPAAIASASGDLHRDLETLQGMIDPPSWTTRRSRTRGIG
jgi:hypothetical protein